MVIKMDTIDGAHAANAISYVLDKEKARKENKPVFLAANNIELNHYEVKGTAKRL